MITCHPTQQQTAPEGPGPDASGFCAFHLNPTSTKWHCVTLSIVPGAWLRKGLRPPGEDSWGQQELLGIRQTGEKSSNIDLLICIISCCCLWGRGSHLQSWLCSGEKSRETQQCANQRNDTFWQRLNPLICRLSLNHFWKKRLQNNETNEESYLNSVNPEFFTLMNHPPLVRNRGSFHCKASAKDLTVSEPVIRLAQASLLACSWQEAADDSCLDMLLFGPKRYDATKNWGLLFWTDFFKRQYFEDSIWYVTNLRYIKI